MEYEFTETKELPEKNGYWFIWKSVFFGLETIISWESVDREGGNLYGE